MSIFNIINFYLKTNQTNTNNYVYYPAVGSIFWGYDKRLDNILYSILNYDYLST